LLLVLLGMLAITPLALADDSPAPVALRVFGIGDCVMLGGSQALSQAIDGIQIDAAVSRQTSTGIQILRARADAGVTEDVVIFHLGNNGPMTSAQIDDVMAALPGVPRVIFVTLTVPRSWEQPNNAIIADAVQRYPNAELADWHAASAGRFDLLWDDGIHLRPDGADAYAALLAPLALAPLPAA
jgi:lysophospholipase L1-like esterase